MLAASSMYDCSSGKVHNEKVRKSTKKGSAKEMNVMDIKGKRKEASGREYML